VSEIQELREQQDELRRQHQAIDQRIAELDRTRYVQIQFHGHSKIYTYEVAPGPQIGIGDYVAVYSPHSEQTELVRVVELGMGDWAKRNQGYGYALKMASRIRWHRDDASIAMWVN
jgi:hypothetical protein